MSFFPLILMYLFPSRGLSFLICPIRAWTGRPARTLWAPCTEPAPPGPPLPPGRHSASQPGCTALRPMALALLLSWPGVPNTPGVPAPPPPAPHVAASVFPLPPWLCLDGATRCPGCGGRMLTLPPPSFGTTSGFPRAYRPGSAFRATLRHPYQGDCQVQLPCPAQGPPGGAALPSAGAKVHLALLLALTRR